MRREARWVWAVGLAAAMAYSGPARAGGVWVTLAAGLPGAADSSSQTELTFDSPHAPPYVGVTSAPGTVSAATAGGVSTFGGLATPVLLDLGSGSAYLAGGSAAPDAAKTRGPGGTTASTPSSVAPATNAILPDSAALLGLTLADPTANGSRDLTATFTDTSGKTLATGTVTVPDGGWWVLGIGPNSAVTPPPVVDPPVTPPPVVDPPVTPPPVVDPPVTPPPVVDPPVVTPPVVTPPTVPPENPGPVATPEPSAFVLAAVGGLATTAVRRLRGRKSA